MIFFKFLKYFIGKIDPYCEISMGSQEHKTSVIANTCNPKWNANMQFFIQNPNEDVLCITVFDKDYFSPNGKKNFSFLTFIIIIIIIYYFIFTEFLGRTEIRISALIHEKNETDAGGPLTKKIALLETESGMVTLRLDLQLFKNQ